MLPKQKSLDKVYAGCQRNRKCQEPPVNRLVACYNRLYATLRVVLEHAREFPTRTTSQIDWWKFPTFIEISKNNYIEYVNESRRDLASAQGEFDNNNLKWALVKIYQSLFLLCNAFLVKHEGFYSKDHECILVALIKHSIIPAEDLNNLASSLRKKDLFEEISAIRVDRNQAMYFPTALRKIDNEAMKQDFINTKEIILNLFEEI